MPACSSYDAVAPFHHSGPISPHEHLTKRSGTVELDAFGDHLCLYIFLVELIKSDVAPSSLLLQTLCIHKGKGMAPNREKDPAMWPRGAPALNSAEWSGAEM